MEERKTKQDKTVRKSSQSSDKKLFAVIRISGMVKVRRDIAETLDRLRLRRKYACVLVNDEKELKGMLEKIKFYVAYGFVDKETLINLIKERGQSVEGKIDAEKIASGLMSGKGLLDFGLKPFFRLHPPRKGIKSKLQYPKGVLGDNGSKINELIRRML